MLLAFFAVRAHCRLMVSLVSTRTPGFSQQSCFQGGQPLLCERVIYNPCYVELFLSRCGTLHFPLLNFLRFPWAQYSFLCQEGFMYYKLRKSTYSFGIQKLVCCLHIQTAFSIHQWISKGRHLQHFLNLIYLQ